MGIELIAIEMDIHQLIKYSNAHK